MLLQTTGYRLLLPALLITFLVALQAGDWTAPLRPLAVAAWALLLSCALLPMARRRSAWAGFLLYAGMALVLVGVLGALIAGEQLGVGIWTALLLPLSLPVLLISVTGWLWPPHGRALVQP